MQSVCVRCGQFREIRARALCASCYNRIRLKGDAAPPLRNKTAAAWLSDVDRSADGCWLWPGPKHSHGYGRAILPSGRQTQAHRFAWTEWVGPIPAGMTLDHVDCESKLCVRPDHLEVVTRAENLRRATLRRTVQVQRVRRCVHGDVDVYVDPSGKRVCRICRRERTRLWRAERKAAFGHY